MFTDLVEHPTALDMMNSVLGWPVLLGNISANITGPGGGEMVLHADQNSVPEPWPTHPQGCNICGTARRRPRRGETETFAMDAPAGSMIVLGYKTTGVGLVNGKSPA